MNNSIFWDIAPSIQINRRFGRTLPFSVRKNASFFLLEVFFDCEDSGNIFLRNVG
jgi:hypothetical protein